MTFARIASAAAAGAATPFAFLTALAMVLLWGALGPAFGYSDRWEAIINTITTIITFLMVFLLQSAQARDTAAMQIKLDEIIRSNAEARNSLIAVEQRPDEDLSAHFAGDGRVNP